MRQSGFVLSAAILLVSSLASPVLAQQGWVQLGARTVADNADRDVISARGEGQFTKIRLCVFRRAVRFYDLDVVFGNGARQDIPVRARIPAGGCTRVIDLRGGERNIRRIVMKYETVRERGPQAVVEVYGRR